MTAALAGAGGGSGLSLVGASVSASTSTTEAITFPPGTKAGDIAILACWDGFAPGSSGVSGGAGGWSENTITWDDYGYGSGLHLKALASGDLAGVTLSLNNNSAYLLAVYRGATGVSVKATNTGQSGSKLSFPGFVKSGSCKGIVTIGHDRDVSSFPTPPPKFLRRAVGGYNYFSFAIADLLEPSLYESGDPVEWNDWLGATIQVGWLLEFT